MQQRRRVLLIEDGKYYGKWILEFLLNLGFDVVWVIKVIEIQEGGVLCACLDVNFDPPKEERVFIQGKDRSFDVILLDGQLGSSARPEHGPHGWDIMPYLAPDTSIPETATPVITISSDKYIRELLIQLGAHSAVESKTTNQGVFKDLLRQRLSQLGLLPE